MAHDFISNAHLMIMSDDDEESPDEKKATSEEIEAWDDAKV